jgi:hypothetical protein
VDKNLNIDGKDVAQVKEFLKGKMNPVDLHDVVYRVALFKTRERRSHKVKMYSPGCEYKVGDLIYKEYPGKIPVGSKKYMEIDSGVVLKVVDVRTRMGFNEIKLSYEGTSDFKKYTSFLERQKIELLLPHRQAKPCEKAEYLPEDIDPRKQQAPMEQRDFNLLTKKLIAVLNKESDIAFISGKVLLSENLKEVSDEAFDKIREFLKENKKSEPTEFFVEHFAKVKPEDEFFDAYCFSLSYRMQRDYKIDFQQTQEEGWGKWNLISVIYYMKKDSPISIENPLVYAVSLADKKNLSHRRRKFEESLQQDTAHRFYLTQREITAGAVRLKPGFYDLGDSIEIEIVDAKQKKHYLVYYYKDVNLMLGFKDIFEKYKALQGAILTFEMVPETAGGKAGQLQFGLRTTKKGTISDRVEYLPEEQAFKATEEKVASPIFVNKAMFLEAAIFNAVYDKLGQYRKIASFNKLVHKVFLEFGVKERNYEIHILRLYHILDLVFPIDIKLLEDVILCNPEFVPAEKLAGVFYLDSDAVAGIEEEELKRKETEVDELKRKRDDLRRKKADQERKIKEEIRRKREERRKKREEEMWEKERMHKELEEKKIEARRAPQKVKPAPPPAHGEKPRRPSAPPKHAQPAPAAPPPPDEIAVKKDHHKRVKKKEEEEKPLLKTPKRGDRKPKEDDMSEDDIKSQIELEKLKDNMAGPKKAKKAGKKKAKEIAYKDEGTGFGGIFASKLDEIVKKESEEE